MAMRAAMHRAGAMALSRLLQGTPPGPDERAVPCPCGRQARYREMRARRVLTAVGEVELLRPWYLCPHCHDGQCPADAALDIEKVDLSPGVRRMLALVGSEASFDHGRRQIELLAGLEVTAKAVERTAEAIGSDIAQGEQRAIRCAIQLDLPMVVGQPIPVLCVEMDGTGIPVVKGETEGRSGKVSGQPAHTREAKIGCVFTQTTWDKEGYANRDPDSMTYVAAIETASEFGKRIYLEAWNRGWARAEKKVVIGDGAEWIWNIADLHFPGAIQIVDLFHARQHLWDVVRKLSPNQDAEQRRWMTIHQPLLDEGKIEELVAALRSVDSSSPELLERFASRPTTSTGTPTACATRNSALNICLSARVSSNRLQNNRRLPLQAVRHVLDRPRSERDPRSALLPIQWTLRGLLGSTQSCLAFTFMSHTPLLPRGTTLLQ